MFQKNIYLVIFCSLDLFIYFSFKNIVLKILTFFSCNDFYNDLGIDVKTGPRTIALVFLSFFSLQPKSDPAVSSFLTLHFYDLVSDLFPPN